MVINPVPVGFLIPCFTKRWRAQASQRRSENTTFDTCITLLRSAFIVLTIWGTSSLLVTNRAEAAPSFEEDAAGNPLAGIDVGSYSAPSFVDIDGDGDLDAFIGAGNGDINFYRNFGTSTLPLFVADVAGNPLAGKSVSCNPVPTFADIDSDGDFDGVFGSCRFPGHVYLFKNNGSKTVPNFANDTLLVDIPGDASQTKPALGDLDGDGDLDLTVGSFNGTLNFFRNNGDKVTPNFNLDSAGNPFSGLDVGSRSAPSFADIDGDGDLDAFVGKILPFLDFFRNEGNRVEPAFTQDEIGNPLGGQRRGQDPIAAFADIDGDGDLDAFIGGQDGTVSFYRNTETKPAPVFLADETGNPFTGIDVGSRATPALADIDGDGDLDAFVGDDSGYVNLLLNVGSAVEPDLSFLGPVLIVDSDAAPALADIDGDGDLDAFIGEGTGEIRFFRNTGTSVSGNFVERPVLSPLAGIDVGLNAAPTFVDIDGDADLDTFLGAADGKVYFLQNNGNPVSPSLVVNQAGNPLSAFDLGSYAVPTFTDLDGDGDSEAYVGQNLGQVPLLRNTGSKTLPSFEADLVGNPLGDVDVGTRSAPTFADLDGDGDLDAFVGGNDGKVNYFRNIATAPTAADNTVTVLEDVEYAFAVTDFSAGYDDVHDDPMTGIRITSLESASLGALKLDNVDVTVGQVIPVADIPNLMYTPAANGNGMGYDTFEFTVTDGNDESMAPNTITIDVTPQNDLPSGTVTISGTLIEDHTLTAGNTLADVDGLGTLHYQWRRNGNPFGGGNQMNHTLVDADVGKSIDVRIFYTDQDGTNESVYSEPTALIENINDPPTGAVMIDGIVREDQVLTAISTLADDDGLGTLFYKWKRDGADIESATNSSYLLGDDDVSTVISVTVDYTDLHGTAESMSSGDTEAVANVNDVPVFTPGPDVTVAANSGSQTIAGWASDISPGPAHEADQNLVGFDLGFAGFTGNLAFDVNPAIDTASGDLTITPKAGTTGSVDVTVTLADDGGVENGGVDTTAPVDFLITVGTNDADLAVTKTNNSNIVYSGRAVTWQIVVDNLGDVDATGVTVQDVLPAVVNDPRWSCAPVGPRSFCGSGGATILGDVHDLVNVQAGAGLGIIITVTGELAEDAQGKLSNTAVLSLPDTILDPNPGNNTSTDTDDIGELDPIHIFSNSFEDSE